MPVSVSSTYTGEMGGDCLRAAILIPFVGSLFLAAGPPEAERLYERAEYKSAITLLNQSPADAQKLELLGQCYFMLGDFRKSTDSLERAAGLAPNDSMIQTWLGRAWGRRAETSFPLTAIGYATKTREAFEKALRLDPANQEALGDLFDFYVDAPGFIGGGMDKAAGLVPHFEKYDPVGAYLAQARLDEKKKQYSSAESHLRRAIDAAPRKAGVIVDLAKFLSRRGRFDESEKAFAQAAAVEPDSARILFERASAYVQAQRNLPEARELLKKYIGAANLKPSDPPRWEARNLLKKAEGG
jgi:tetratricopeptide (TPR) repeat protein